MVRAGPGRRECAPGACAASWLRLCQAATAALQGLWHCTISGVLARGSVPKLAPAPPPASCPSNMRVRCHPTLPCRPHRAGHQRAQQGGREAAGRECGHCLLARVPVGRQVHGAARHGARPEHGAGGCGGRAALQQPGHLHSASPALACQPCAVAVVPLAAVVCLRCSDVSSPSSARHPEHPFTGASGPFWVCQCSPSPPGPQPARRPTPPPPTRTHSYDLKIGAGSNDAPLHAGVICVSLGTRYSRCVCVGGGTWAA